MEINKIKLANGFTLNLRCWGPANGIPVIAIHGLMDNAGSFDLLAPRLPTLKIYAVDLPGHGFSDHLPPTAYYHLLDNIPFIIQLANQLNLEEFSLIGHSYGALISQALGAMFQDRINKIVLLDAIAMRSFDEAGYLKHLQEFFRFDPSKMMRHTYTDTFEESVKRRENGMFPVSPEGAACLAAGGVRKTEKGYAWTFDNRLRFRYLGLYPPKLLKLMLNAITAKVCCIIATDGVLLGPNAIAGVNEDLIKECIAWLQDAEHHIIDSNHHLHLENPEEVASIIGDFFNK